MNSADKSAGEYKKMTESSVTGLVLKLSVPTVVSMLITSAYNMADTYFVSSLGNSATGAVGIVFSIQSVIQAVGFGIGMGCSSLISRKLGERDKDAADRYASSGFVCAVTFGLLLMLIGLIDLDGMMRLFGSTDTILPYACSYGFVILLGAPVMCSSFVLNNILRAEGRANMSMIGLCAGGVVNIILDPIFIYTLDFGVQGAAIATVISQCVSFTILICFFISGKSIVKLSPACVSRRFTDYFTLIKTGFPTICRQGLGSLSTTLLNISVRPYGDAAVAAVSIANKIYMLLRNMIIGVGQGFQPVAGYNYGAGKPDRVKKSFLVATVIGSVFSCAAALTAGLFGGSLMALFRGGDTEVIEIGRLMLIFMSASLPVLAYSTYVNQLYQGLGFVFGATFLASCRQGIFFIPLILILPRVMGLVGIQSAQAIADLATFAVSVPFRIWFFRRVLNKRDNKENKQIT